MVLRRYHFIAVADQQLDDLAETGSVGPQAMCEDNAGFAGHAAPPRTVTSLSDARMFGRRVRKGRANFLLEALASLSRCGFFSILPGVIREHCEQVQLLALSGHRNPRQACLLLRAKRT